MSNLLSVFLIALLSMPAWGVAADLSLCQLQNADFEFPVQLTPEGLVAATANYQESGRRIAKISESSGESETVLDLAPRSGNGGTWTVRSRPTAGQINYIEVQAPNSSSRQYAVLAWEGRTCRITNVGTRSDGVITSIYERMGCGNLRLIEDQYKKDGTNLIDRCARPAPNESLNCTALNEQIRRYLRQITSETSTLAYVSGERKPGEAAPNLTPIGSQLSTNPALVAQNLLKACSKYQTPAKTSGRPAQAPAGVKGQG